MGSECCKPSGTLSSIGKTKLAKKRSSVPLVPLYNFSKMPPKRGKQKPKAKPVSDLLITSLDQQALEVIINYLPDDDKATFASAHPLFLRAYRNMVTNAHSWDKFDKLDAVSNVLALHPNLTSISLGIDLKNGSSSLYDLKGPQSIRRMSIIFDKDPPSRRGLSALADNFSNLRSLALRKYGSDRDVTYKGKGRFFNTDGSFKALSALRNLEELTVNCLFSDDGFQHLTSLTKLTIDFPSLDEEFPHSLYCHGCCSIHLDAAEDLEVYTKSIPWKLGIVMGKNIGVLPKLKEFTIDFETSEQHLGYSAVLNRLLLRAPSSSQGAGGSKRSGSSHNNSTNDNIHLPPHPPLYFQNLESIEFLNCGGPDHFLYTPTMNRRISYPSEGLAANDLWHTCVIWESMKNFPKLKKWRLHAFDDGPDSNRVEAVDVSWPCACGCGTVTGKVVEGVLPCGCGTSRTFVEIDRPEGL